LAASDAFPDVVGLTFPANVRAFTVERVSATADAGAPTELAKKAPHTNVLAPTLDALAA
jgi:hypothetical protein